MHILSLSNKNTPYIYNFFILFYIYVNILEFGQTPLTCARSRCRIFLNLRLDEVWNLGRSITLPATPAEVKLELSVWAWRYLYVYRFVWGLSSSISTHYEQNAVP